MTLRRPNRILGRFGHESRVLCDDASNVSDTEADEMAEHRRGLGYLE